MTEVRGFGRQKGTWKLIAVVEYTVDLLPKIKLEIITADDQVRKVADTITKAARTGEIGDGKIFISDLVDCTRIRTGESGDSRSRFRCELVTIDFVTSSFIDDSSRYLAIRMRTD